MNDQIVVFIRYALTALGSYAVAKGWLTVSNEAGLEAALMNAWPTLLPLAMAIIGVVTSSKSAKVAAVQAMPDMEVATSNQAVKDAVPGVTMAKPGAAQVVVPAPIATK